MTDEVCLSLGHTWRLCGVGLLFKAELTHWGPSQLGLRTQEWKQDLDFVKENEPIKD